MARNSYCKMQLVLTLAFAAGLMAAPPNRITRAVDARQTNIVPGHLHRLAQPQFDRGAVDPAMRMDYMVLLTKPSAAQQSELDRLLADQQNPSSPQFHKWLTPEEFGNRFGLSASDHSKIVAWLTSEGFTVDHQARGRNWVAFSGTAAQVTRSLHTPLHRFQVDGEMHFANTSEPAVPEALSDVAGGFIGLNDFRLQSMAVPVPPEYNAGTSHFLVPEDFATIYNVTPLYQAGIDGTGQSIAVVGQSDILLSDIRAFRARYNLPANDPKLVPYSTIDPGFNGAQIEGNLDVEWAGAVAPKAAIYYVYGPNAITAIVAAVEMNVAPIISISYGTCEINVSAAVYRSIAQQGNAQGITLLSASGDSGAAGCDSQGSEPFATRGRMVDFPAVMPEVTAVGGTQFVEGDGTYWASANSPNFGSAVSYIPEAAWNESGSVSVGLLSSGGGGSVLYPRPAWQTGPGLPNDSARHVPDIALSAALHDAYFIYALGANGAVGGTSASAPSMAGIIALLNQYQVIKGFQKQSGLGNINPQLYRLAQIAPSVFHDISAGDNIVRCAQGSPDCLTGSFGYSAGSTYDQATGLGSVDADALVTQWNTATQGVVVRLSSNMTTATLNDTIQLTAKVAPESGSGAPTGTVQFSSNGLAFGSATLANGTATLSYPLYLIVGSGTLPIAAEYSGDAAFSSGGAEIRIRLTLPTGVAAISPVAPNTVWPSPSAQGLTWQTTLTLREVAGVPALLTGFTMNGQAQPLAQFFPSPNIPANGSISGTVLLRNMIAPVTMTFGFTGTDPTGHSWSRQVSVNYYALPEYNYFNLAATPLTVAQNTAADPSCQWPVQLNVDDLGGFGFFPLNGLYTGNEFTSGVNYTSRVASVFGTTRLDAWGGLQGTFCFGGITPPATETIFVSTAGGTYQALTVSFAGPPASPGKLSASPATISLAAPTANTAVQTKLSLNLSDKTQPWTAAVYPANRTTSWLSLSQRSGIGSAPILLTASGAGFEPGVYRATIVFQSPNAIPQYINVPVMFVLGGSPSGTSIGGVVLYGSNTAVGSPGTLLSIFGANLAESTDYASGNPAPYSLDGVSATVNGLAAPVLFVSPDVLNIQVPYEVGAGPAVLGVNNNGQIAGFPFQMAPASPGIQADSMGNAVPDPMVKQGGSTTLYVAGVGDVSPILRTAFSPSPLPPNIPAAVLPKPVLPLSVTVGGVPAFVRFAGIAPGLIGVAQVNIIVPASVPKGTQPAVVTVGGVASPPVNLVIQ